MSSVRNRAVEPVVLQGHRIGVNDLGDAVMTPVHVSALKMSFVFVLFICLLLFGLFLNAQKMGIFRKIEES